MADESSNAAERVRSHRKGHSKRRRKSKRAVEEEGEDSISSLPDVILQHILCLIPTKSAIRTSVLSKRWKHVWCNIPSLSVDANIQNVASINKTLTRYTAPTLKDFHLKYIMTPNSRHINRLIKFAMSHNVENLSLDFQNHCCSKKYKFPGFFYINSSVKELNIKLSYCHEMIPNCSVSWTSLHKLSLSCSYLSDDTMAKILSGCPVLESLTLCVRNRMKVLDLSNLLRLRTLKVKSEFWGPGTTQIVAPQIRCLILKKSELPCTLVDVSSLTEAKINIGFIPTGTPNMDYFLDKLLEMLEKLQYVEKLTLGGNFLEVLSLAVLCGLPFPMLKVKDLTLETMIYQYVIPGVERLLQNSHDLEKLTVRVRNRYIVPVARLENYLNNKGFNPDQCCRSKDGVIWNEFRGDVKSKHLVSFVELMLKNTITLDKMVLLLEKRYFKKLLPKLPHNNNVSIALYKDKPKT